MFKDKNIVIGITGGIACYKACDIVSYLVLETNLWKQMIKKEFEEIHHGIENLEKFISLSQDPKAFLIFFGNLSICEINTYNRICREIIKKAINPSSDLNIVKTLYEGKIFKNVLNLISCCAETGSQVTEIEGIFDSLLVVDNSNVIDIFYKNKFQVKNNFSKLIDDLLKKQYYELNMNAVLE